MPPDPWIFGWTELLELVGHVVTAAGFIVAAVVATRGIRTFEMWKQEQLEERRIETALEALALTYEAKYIFDNIRSPMSFEYEWKDMPKRPADSDADLRRRGPFYAVRKRVLDNRDFFERVFKVQPRCMALFGPSAEPTFLLLHKARRKIEVASEMLMDEPQQQADPDFWMKLRRNVWGVGEAGEDEVGKKLADFRSQMEALCRPIVDRELRPPKRHKTV